MIKIPVTYEDFDGNEVTENCYFHLSKSELIEMSMTEEDGHPLAKKLEMIADSGDRLTMMSKFKEIIGQAYGERVDGSGSQFYKSPELTKRFLGSLAFDQLLMNLVSDSDFAVMFTNGLLPKDIAKLGELGAKKTTDVALPGPDGQPDITDISKSGLVRPLDANSDPLPWAFREPTQNEMRAMNSLQMQDVYSRKSSGWKPPVSV